MSASCSQPIPAADSKLLKVLRPYLENQLSQVLKEDQRLVLIRRKIADSIRDGHPDLRHVAKATGVQLAHGAKAIEQLRN